MAKGILFDYIQTRKNSVTYITEGTLLELNEKIVSIMAEKKMSRSQLAEKLGTSNAYITKLLNGLPNLTIETMVKISQALDAELKIDMVSTAEDGTFKLLTHDICTTITRSLFDTKEDIVLKNTRKSHEYSYEINEILPKPYALSPTQLPAINSIYHIVPDKKTRCIGGEHDKFATLEAAIS